MFGDLLNQPFCENQLVTMMLVCHLYVDSLVMFGDSWSINAWLRTTQAGRFVRPKALAFPWPPWTRTPNLGQKLLMLGGLLVVREH